MNDIATIIFYGSGTLVALYLFLWWLKPRSLSSSLDYQGKSYPCRIGDDLMDLRGRSFRGIEVTLSKSLPHIYIDGHAGDRLRGPRVAFKKEMRLNLEGGFNDHFQAYAVPEYRWLALTILTPDVMAVLTDYLRRYDIELEGDRLRIITHDKVYKSPARQDALKRLALLLLPDIVHKMRSWPAYDELDAGTARMELIEDSTTKLGRHGVHSSVIGFGLIFAFIGIPLSWLGIWSLGQESLNDGIFPWVCIGLGVLMFPIAVLVIGAAVRGNFFKKTF